MNGEGFFLGRLLIIIGVILVIAGGILLLAGRLPGLGRLPGDIYIKKDNFVLFFPITTMIIISIIISLLLRLFSR